MNFNVHSDLAGQHAFLGASKYHWINYDEEKIDNTYKKFLATQRGTELHALAAECIRLGVRLAKTKKTLNLYVNDAIGYMMTPEQPLYYSENCFGTADAIGFRKNLLRIHDLKNGETPGSFQQLKIYAALFCLEYRMNPNDIGIELRIYQFDDALIHEPTPEEIQYVMNKIIVFDKRITKLKMEA